MTAGCTRFTPRLRAQTSTLTSLPSRSFANDPNPRGRSSLRELIAMTDLVVTFLLNLVSVVPLAPVAVARVAGAELRVLRGFESVRSPVLLSYWSTVRHVQFPLSLECSRTQFPNPE